MRSFSQLAAGEAGARILGFVAVILMARRLSPSGFGVVAFGTALLAYFRIMVDSGTEFLAVRDVARTPERFRAIAEPILGLRLALSLAAMALFCAGALLISAEPADRYAVLLFALILPLVALNLRWMVLGLDKARAVAVGNIANQLMVAIGVVLLVHDRHDTPWVPLAMAVGELAYAGFVTWAVARRFGLPVPRFDLPVWRDVLRSGLPLFVNNLARTALYSFDVFLIAWVLTSVDVGLYAAAYKPVMVGSALVGLLSVAFLASYSAPHSEEQRSFLLRRTAAIAGGVAALGALVLTVAAGTLLTVVVGDAYAGSATALAILAWTLPLLALTGPYMSALISADEQRRVMRNNLIAAAFNVVANFAAVPLAGIEGAASVTVTSFVIVLVLTYRDARKLGLADPIRKLQRPGERELVVAATVAPDSESA